LAQRRSRSPPATGGRGRTPEKSSAAPTTGGLSPVWDLGPTLEPLERLRLDLMADLKESADPAHARDLLTETNLALVSSRLSFELQSVFWRKVSAELDVAAQYSGILADPEDGRRLRSVISAARLAIGSFQRILAYEEGKAAVPPATDDR
jgi:hypothetical protein